MRTFLIALLGTPPGSSDHIHANLRWLADFQLAYQIFSKVEAIPASRQLWLSSVHISRALEALKKDRPASENLSLHGPRTSERFVLPVSADTEPFYHRYPNGCLLKSVFLNSLRNNYEELGPEDQLIIMFFGRGSDDGEGKRGERIECGADLSGPVWVAKTEVEAMLDKNRRVSVISTSCFAGAWQSDKWALFAAAQSGSSLALPPSASDRSWGSSFVASIPEMAANALGSTFHPASGDDHILPDENIQEAFHKLCSAIHSNHSMATAHDFTPTTPFNIKWSGWTAIMGIAESADIVMALHALPRRPANPSSWEHLQFGSPSLAPVTRTFNLDEAQSLCIEPSSHVEDHNIDLSFNPVELDKMVAHWDSTTRPLELTTAPRLYLATLIHRFQIGQSPTHESHALYRLFEARLAADQLAEDVAREFGLSETVACKDYREVDGIPPCEGGVSLDRVYWGPRIAPADNRVVNRLGHPYRKAGQWLFGLWSVSGESVAVLEGVLNRVGGKIM
ncbi:hypothetical protein B0H11DRAFT_2079430 [Mycena galericulata]|nr:hypothetical protein B0H11DRAFT_2079430 [Mycena galericulata]